MPLLQELRPQLLDVDALFDLKILADMVEEQRVVLTNIQVLDLNVCANRIFLANRQLGKQVLVLEIVGQRGLAVSDAEKGKEKRSRVKINGTQIVTSKVCTSRSN